MPATLDFEVRNLRFTFDDTIPKFWHGGSPLRTALLDSQSLFFPAGERFFVDSVKRFIPQLKDQRLRRQAQLFCGQEAVHQREHLNYNRMLERRGYPALRLQNGVERYLRLITRIIFPRWRLAVTCALEHFTAISANAALTNPSLFDGAEPRMAAFWRWHAGEETEHKAVPFDVYQAVGGHYSERVLIMLSASLVFQAYSLLHLFIFLWSSGNLFSPRTWWDFLRGDRPMSSHTLPWRSYFAYFRPGFHPDQLATDAALAAFRNELASSKVYADAAP